MRRWLFLALAAILATGGVYAALRPGDRPTSLPPAELMAVPLPANADFEALLIVEGGAQDRRNWLGPEGEVSAFDLATLDRLPQREIVTSTDWTDGEKLFRGVLLRDLLAAVGAGGHVVKARGRNEYFVDIPMEDAKRYDVLVATHMDGEALQPRNKGPLWLIYPRDDHRELRDPLYNSRWVSSLVDLKVE